MRGMSQIGEHQVEVSCLDGGERFLPVARLLGFVAPCLEA